MHPLNPFLRAFFRSALPSQCVPVHDHILLVPPTDLLLSSWDRESDAAYTDLVGWEEFLGSHVLRLPASSISEPGRDGGTTRDGRGKTKRYSTINGKTVVIKEAVVYTNRGFKTLTQAQLLSDTLWDPDRSNPQRWLVYYISRPLVGSPEPIISPVRLLGPSPRRSPVPAGDSGQAVPESSTSKKDIRTFGQLLDAFPMIARQMQPGLTRLFKELDQALRRSLSPRPAQSELTTAAAHDLDPATSATSDGQPVHPNLVAEDEEAVMRRALESIVTGAIDLFQLVDRQQLSHLGATTTVTGPMVERLIERYVVEQAHHSVLFPRICAMRRVEDQDLEAKIRQMEHIDLPQLGFRLPAGLDARQELRSRLDAGVTEFRRLGVAGSPHEMLEILLATEKRIAMTAAAATTTAITAPYARSPPRPNDLATNVLPSEKPMSAMAMNADTLVSLLLMVVIRSQVRHLHARLTCMHHFIFIDDVDTGETGYALSTFEAVVSYLARASTGVRTASRKNKILWDATRSGRIDEMRRILEPGAAAVGNLPDPDLTEEREEDWPHQHYHSERADLIASSRANGSASTPTVHAPNRTEEASATSSLAHVFPFHHTEDDPTTTNTMIASRSKRVSMDLRSVSSSSGRSFHSRTLTIDSNTSATTEGVSSIDRLAKVQDPSGESLMMMTIENRQPEALRYLLSLSQYYPLEAVLEDSNDQGTTLLSAAVQTGQADLTEILLPFLLRAEDDVVMAKYLARQDLRGRTMAHYLFHAHHLIDPLARLLPWRLPDRNGQTPLFALCRSYDHPSYRPMVNSALIAAEATQGDGRPLHLDDHVDSKGNTLLHIIHDRQLVRPLLRDCDSDVNATNDKQFTPLMVASKYGRVDLVNVLIADPRVDPYVKDLRGLTAVELAKDDNVRNRIDDLVLLSTPPDPDGRIAAVVRSFCLEDGSVRVVVKTAVSSSKNTITITSCRRSLSDFQNLAYCLSIEHPSSWLPSTDGFRSPIQVPSRPSRAVLREIQLRLDGFVKMLLAHSTFATHEMVWEFFLVPEILPEMMVERSRKKAAVRAEKVREEFVPVADPHGAASFALHARREVGRVGQVTKELVRCVNKLRTIEWDFVDAHQLCVRGLSASSLLDQRHIKAFAQFVANTGPPVSSPYTILHQDLQSISISVSAMLASLSQPGTIVDAMTQASHAIDRHLTSLRRSDRWPLGLLDGTRNKIHQEAAHKVERATLELATLGSELRYTQQTVAGELAAWQDLHEVMLNRALTGLTKRMVIVEKMRLEGMKRALRCLES